jgi:hypothetical protein
MWKSTTPGITGASSMNYGKKAAAIPGCCSSLVDLTVAAW